jgi:hypothetical protein
MRHCLVGGLLALAFGSATAEVQMNQYGLTGSWYNPLVSGQGFMLEVYPSAVDLHTGVLFGGWFTYDDQTGQQIWLTLQGDVNESQSSSRVALFAAQNGYFDKLPKPSTFEVGFADISFSDCTHGKVDYSFSTTGKTGTVPITRLTNNLTCSDTGAPQLFPSNSSYWLSGAWYDKAVPGQGLMFDIDPYAGILFGGWFTFANDTHRSDSSANQRWFSLQLSRAPQPQADLTNIPIYSTTGGKFTVASAVTVTQVGTATLSTTDCDNLQLDYTFTAGENNGASGTMHLARPGPTPVSCDFNVLH